MERTEVGTVIDAERRYGLSDPAAVWYLICGQVAFMHEGRMVVLVADERYNGDGPWKVEEVQL